VNGDEVFIAHKFYTLKHGTPCGRQSFSPMILGVPHGKIAIFDQNASSPIDGSACIRQKHNRKAGC
jgi:hypothetical protein